MKPAGARYWNAAARSMAAVVLATSALAIPPAAFAQEPFARGNVTGTVVVGRGEALGNTYTTLGAGIGYMVSEGLMLGLNGELWMGEDPSIQKLTPEIRYTFTKVNPVKPYVGAFFTRTFYEDYEDRNSYGARGGIYIPFSTNAAMNVGLVYEQVADCDEATYGDCSQVYPEVGLLISF